MVPKRGLGWPWDNTRPEFDLYQGAIGSGKIGWLFNWEMWKPDGCPSGIEYVPQCRLGSAASSIDQFVSHIGGAKNFIGFNEPEMASESNMSVEQAVDLWRQYILPAKDKFHFRLGSPAMTSSPQGKQWLQNFFQHLGGSHSVDFVVCHWYGSNVQDLYNFLGDMHKTFQKPLWLNEFAYSFLRAGPPAPSVDEVQDFLNQAIPFLENCDFIERYAFFGAKTDVGPWVGSANNLSNQGHSLTGPGELYCNM